MEPIKGEVTQEQNDTCGMPTPTYEELESFNKQLQERLTDQIEKTKAFGDKAYKAERALEQFKSKYQFLESTLIDQIDSVKRTMLLADITNTK